MNRSSILKFELNSLSVGLEVKALDFVLDDFGDVLFGDGQLNGILVCFSEFQQLIDDSQEQV